MAYKKQNDLLKPLLELLNAEEYLSLEYLIEKLADVFDLNESFLNKRYEISNMKVFENTVQWKINDLHKSGLIEFIKKNNKRHFIITNEGKNFLNCSNNEIIKHIKNTYFKNLKEQKKEKVNNEDNNIDAPLNNEITPLDLLERSYSTLRNQIYDEILETILSKSPAAFEQLVTELLQKMGYGDGRVTQISRDGGIDAKVKGDVLGFEQIYVQAKRYQRDTTIGSPEIQRFIGALLGLEGNAIKGVFITTAKFSNEAHKIVQNFSKARIVLIDGTQLAKYMYDYELGVQNEKTFSIKKLDNDFWEAMEND